MKILYKNCLICQQKFNNLRRNGYTLGLKQWNKNIVCGWDCLGKLRSKRTNRNSFKCKGSICTMIFYEKGIKKETIFDKKFLQKIKKYCWYGVHQRYAHTINKGYKILLHKLILNGKKGFVTDHINGNGLDNRLKNLRLVTQKVNSINMSIQKRSTTGRRGVYEIKYKKKTGAIRISYVAHLGKIQKCFKTLKEAIYYREQLEKRYGFDKYMDYRRIID